MALDLAKRVAQLLQSKKMLRPSVEEIQDAVEKVLIEHGHARTAKDYILYRAERSRIREMNTRLMKVYEDLTFKGAQENDLKRENANIDGDTAMGTMLKYGSEGAKRFYEMFVLHPAHAKAHADGDIHIHDVDFLTLTTTCCQIDLIKLFRGGFSTGHGFLREPNDIQSYSALACIAIQSNQNDQHGGQSVPNFDYALADGVKKTYKKLYLSNLGKAMDTLCGTEDGETKALEIAKHIESSHGLIPVLADDNGYREKEASYLHDFLRGPTIDQTTNPAENQLTDEQIIEQEIRNEHIQKIQSVAKNYAQKEVRRATYQAMEAFVHNLNTMHSRAGAQVPFSSINYGTDTSPEGRLVTQCVLQAADAGLGNGETPIFPIHIFKVKEGINYNPGDPNHDLFRLACKVSAKRLFPNFSFLDAPFNLQYYRAGNYDTEVAYMGCRTRVIGNVHDKSRQTVGGRGNLSFTSINLPRLGITAKGDVNVFFDSLGNMVSLVIEQLMERYKIQAAKKVKNFPFLMGQGIWLDSDKLGVNDSVGEILKHGTLTMGFIGLAECLKALLGSHHGESAEARELGLQIVGYMRKRLDEQSAKTGFNYTLIATPAEGLAGRFVRIDKEKYGVIEGVTDREYYTNSFHVPVYYHITAFDKITIEAPYHAMTNAGHITYVELDGDPSKNLEAFESVIRFMKERGVGYGSINHPVDRDPVCGYTGIIDNECPRCHRTEDDGVRFERIRRITGYLVGTVERFNDAKRAEESERVKHGMGKGFEII